MINPFEHLRKEREAREAMEAEARNKEMERERQKQLDQEQRLQAWREQEEQAQKFDEMIWNLLKELQEAAYPGTEFLHPNACTWSIGTRESYVRDSKLYGLITSYYDKYLVSIQLEFNQNNVPIHFICKREIPGREPLSAVANLSYDSLVQALNQLHRTL